MHFWCNKEGEGKTKPRFSPNFRIERYVQTYMPKLMKRYRENGGIPLLEIIARR